VSHHCNDAARRHASLLSRSRSTEDIRRVRLQNLGLSRPQDIPSEVEQGDPAEGEIVLLSFPRRGDMCTSSTPFGGKVETMLRIAKIPYRGYVSSPADKRAAPKGKVRIALAAGGGGKACSRRLGYHAQLPQCCNVSDTVPAMMGAYFTALEHLAVCGSATGSHAVCRHAARLRLGLSPKEARTRQNKPGQHVS
jgi:hypothetical protein